MYWERKMAFKIKGKKNGIEKTYYSNGSKENGYVAELKSRTYYENGLKNGLEEEYAIWPANAIVTHRCFYKNGVKDGKEEYYDRDDIYGVAGTFRYKAGKLDGQSYVYNISNKFKQQNKDLEKAKSGYNYYRNGELVQQAVSYSERSWKDSKSYYQDGKLVAMAARTNDKPDEYTYTYPDSKEQVNPNDKLMQYIAEIDAFAEKSDEEAKGLTIKQEREMIAGIRAAEEEKSKQMALEKIQAYRKSVAKALGLGKVKAPGLATRVEMALSQKLCSK